MTMKHMIILAAFAASIFALPAVASSTSAPSGGSLDTTTTGAQFSASTGTAGVSKKKKKIKPGKCHDNGDVNVCNTGDHGVILVTPEEGDKDSATDIKTGTGSSGDITGLDGNDKVKVGSSSNVNITGTGGTITMQGGSSAQVTNLGGDGSTNMNVILPGGSTISVPPGSSIFIQN